MVNFKIQLSAQLENVQEILVRHSRLLLAAQFRCTSCQEVTENWDSYEISGSRGEANLVIRCKLCKRESTASFVGGYSVYNEEHSGQYASLAELDCRGLEPVEFKPRDHFLVVASSGARFEDVDLSEKEWFDYDEKSGDSVSIMELETQIKRV
ncbi:hypothetical protein THASP1DRAFT_28654 [Thamnocephalis sphaerospora]|uniref:DUF866-domain-containing protein n=1 Tax=Thamnocephalis sphaerospora TaxID=78915 RepID=A0A4P9XUC4_9FUNG|nr:hypothetical protein THASP1DRAFT_28654 [Thamnocephalis sphaerospora]|eukprot:RKP09552.1 hypothetical protein THASP1DRAFT_28654 [Thamnocephalis sphaerospora]